VTFPFKFVKVCGCWHWTMLMPVLHGEAVYYAVTVCCSEWQTRLISLM